MVALVALVIIAPAVLLAQQLVARRARECSSSTSSLSRSRRTSSSSSIRGLEPVVQWLERSSTPSDDLNRVASTVSGQLSWVSSGLMWALTQLLITLYILFYFIRDHREGANWLRSLVPLSDRETDEVFDRVQDTVYATIYGTVVVALVQGIVGGLLFWAVRLPAPCCGEALVAVLALVPVLGPFVIFIPAALLLAVQEKWPALRDHFRSAAS